MAIRTASRDRGATAGARDRFFVVQERPETVTKDASGTPIDGPWTTLHEAMPGEQIALEGRERFDAQQLTTPYDTRWRIPYVSSMDPELLNVPKLRRLIYRERVHDIVAAKNLGRFEGIELSTIATSKEPN